MQLLLKKDADLESKEDRWDSQTPLFLPKLPSRLATRRV